MLFQKVRIKVWKIRTDRLDKMENKENMLYMQKRKHRMKRKAAEKNLKERIRSLKKRRSLHSPICKDRLSGKVSFCTFLEKAKAASLAVETALVLPIFFMGIITLISFMDIYKIQTEHLTLLCQKAKEAGMYAYVPDGGGMENIVLPDVYAYKPVGGLIPLPKIWMHNTVRVHGWTGTSPSSLSDQDKGNSGEKMVYVTESGNVYHRSLNCSYLNLSVEQVSGASIEDRKNQYGEKYTACEICSRNQKPAGVVFITGKSNRYHNTGSCSGLKRTVRMIKESDAKGMGACGRCG